MKFRMSFNRAAGYVDPAGLIKMFASLQNNLVTELGIQLKATAESYQKTVKSNIGTWGPYTSGPWGNWPALSDAWLAKKKAHGGNENFWAFEGLLDDAVKVFPVQRTGMGVSVSAGVGPGGPITSLPFGITNNETPFIKAIDNEFGSWYGDKYVPPRPLFAPSFWNVTSPELRDGLSRAVIDAGWHSGFQGMMSIKWSNWFAPQGGAIF